MAGRPWACRSCPPDPSELDRSVKWHGWSARLPVDLASLALDPATDVDLVICLGDYVYEAGPADGVTVPGRVDPDAPQVSLADFRRQYHRYRTDPDLQAMHAAFPFVGIFDNHDGLSDPTDPAGPGAIAAFFEQLPVRRSASEPNRQHRSFLLGDLAELFLLDERQHRDPEPPSSDHPLGTSSVEEPAMVDPSRTMLGADQRAWLTDGLSASGAAWKVLGTSSWSSRCGRSGSTTCGPRPAAANSATPAGS